MLHNRKQPWFSGGHQLIVPPPANEEPPHHWGREKSVTKKLTNFIRKSKIAKIICHQKISYTTICLGNPWHHSTFCSIVSNAIILFLIDSLHESLILLFQIIFYIVKIKFYLIKIGNLCSLIRFKMIKYVIKHRKFTKKIVKNWYFSAQINHLKTSALGQTLFSLSKCMCS